MTYRTTLLALGLSVLPALAFAQNDSAFRAMQSRGQRVMGVDQYTSTHMFNDLADGGIVELQRDTDDAAGIAEIRRHLQSIARAFKSGDFSSPALVHWKEVPGAATMAARRKRITYTYKPLPRGGEVRMVTRDREALQAIHEFIAFQRNEHHAGGH